MSTTALKPPQATERLNGIDVSALRQAIENVSNDPRNGATRWGVTTRWAGGTVSESNVTACEIGGQRIAKDFKLRVDEPLELCGTNTAANPQEHLLAALNACMMVGYVAQASLHGIELESIEIETRGDIDLRKFMGIDMSRPAGYEQLEYVVRIKAAATPDQLAKIHDAVIATSPNRFNLANPVPLKAKLVVE